MSDVATAPRTVVKQLDHAVFYSDGTILLKEVRASYPHLDKPFAGLAGQPNQGAPKYTIQALIPKTDEYKPSVFAVRDEINSVMREAKIPALPPDRKCLRDGDNTGKPEQAGHYTLNAAEQRPPALRGARRDQRTGRLEVIPNEQAGAIFYGGCYVNVLVRLWPQNNQFGKRVNANLLAVQFVRDGEAFGQGRIGDDAIDESFGPIDDDDSGYDEGLGDSADDIGL